MIAWRRRYESLRYVRIAPWPWPTFFVLLAIALGLLVPAIERTWDLDIYSDFGVGAAQALLSAFASGFITVLGLSFSLAIAALTFGSSAVTPRIIV